MAYLRARVEGIATGTNQVNREKGDTWPKLLSYNYKAYGASRKAMRYKRRGIWQAYTWLDYYTDTKYLALGLLALGFEPGDKLLIVGDNAPQWYSAELAAQANRGVSVGVYSDATSSEVEYIARNSESAYAVVEDQEQVDKLLETKDRLPLIKKVIYWNYKGLAHYADPLLLGYREALQMGREFESEHPGLFEENVEAGEVDDPCAIVYTAGTTEAAPKGALHTYGSMMAGALSYLQLNQWFAGDNIVPFLPPAWMSEQWFSFGCHLLSGCILNFPEAPETQARDAREIAPTIAFHGARLWESRAAMVQSRIMDTDALKRLVFRILMPIGFRVADVSLQGQKPGLLTKMFYALADRVLFRGVRESLGMARARICYSTGAILSPEATKFYHAIGVPIKSVYATTEGGPLTGVRKDDIYSGTVGSLLEDSEARIDEKGELLYRTPGAFSGYYKDPEKTSAVMMDGWFHSGDSALFDAPGHLRYVDRANSVIELASGTRVAPQLVESSLRSSPYVKDAWIVAGEARSYLTAMVVINYANVSKWAGQQKIAFNTFGELSQSQEVYELICNDIERVNEGLPTESKIRKFVNLDREFDVDQGELTKTRNLKRVVLAARYRSLVDALYADGSEASTEALVRHQDGREEIRKTTLAIKVVKGVVS
jgi:long-chain acyl-CoA synthetase